MVFGSDPALVCFGVWLAVILNAKNHLQAVLWWVPRPDILSLATTFRTFCYGASYGLSDVTVQSCPAVIAGIVIIIFGLFFIKGLFVIFTSHLQNHVRLFIIWLFLPVALTFLFCMRWQRKRELLSLFIVRKI